MYVSKHEQTLSGERYEVGDTIPDGVLSEIEAARLIRYGWLDERPDSNEPRPPAAKSGKEKSV